MCAQDISTKRVVGVLGGMGPEATILLQQRLLEQVAAQDDSDHLPLFIDMNPQVPSRIAHLIEGTGPSPAPTLAMMARRLQAAGATALALPCNTAHHYSDAITQAVSIPFLNMIDLSVAKAVRDLPTQAQIGFLASPAVRSAGVFDQALARAGLLDLWPAQQDKLLACIRSIKAKGVTPDAVNALNTFSAELEQAGAQALFIACSEFSLLSRQIDCALPIIDTIDVLARSIAQHIQAQEVSQ